MAITDEQVKAAKEAFNAYPELTIEELPNAWRAALEAAEATGAQAKKIEKLEEANVFCRSAFLNSRDRIAELEAETAKLREALKPFADEADEIPINEETWEVHFSAKCFRAARAALGDNDG